MPPYTISVVGGVVQDLTTVSDRLPDDGETVPASIFKMQPGGKGSNSAVAIHRLSRPNPTKKAIPQILVQDASDSQNESQAQEEDELYNKALNQLQDAKVEKVDAVEEGEKQEPLLNVRMVGVVGDNDNFGPVLIDNLKKCGVDTEGVETMQKQDTAVANILVEAESGANRIMQYPGAAAHVDPARFTTAESLGGGVKPDFMVAQLEIHRDAIEQAIETAYKCGVEVMLNPSPAYYLMPDIYPMICHLVMNETEAVMLANCEPPQDMGDKDEWGKIADYFHEQGTKNVVITLGEKGAVYSVKLDEKVEKGYVEPDTSGRVYDTSGAGYVIPIPLHR